MSAWLDGERAEDWHRQRFPSATMERVALKLASECGELCDAIIAVASDGEEHPERAGEVGREAADVAIVLLVLLYRYFPDVDLQTEVTAKLNRLWAALEGAAGEETT